MSEVREAPDTPLVVRAAALALIYVFPWYPFVPRFALAGPLGIDDVLPLAVLALCVPALLVRHKLASRRELLALGVLAVIASVAALLRANGFWGPFVAVLRTSGRLVIYGLVLASIVSLLNAAERRRFVTMILAVTALEGLIGVICYVGKLHGPWQMGMLQYPLESIPADGRVRVQGTFGGEVPIGEPFLNRANFYSAYLALGLMGLGAFLRERRYRVWVGLATAAIVGGIMVSYSRMSLAAAFAGFLVVALLYRRLRLFVPMLVVVLVALAAIPALRERFFELGSDRVGQWSIALRVIGDHPLLGTGDGRYLEAALLRAEGIEVPVVRTPHNSILYAMASYGIPAGLALLALYVVLVSQALKRFRMKGSALAATQVGVVVTFLTNDITNNLFFIPEVALAFWAFYAATYDDSGEALSSPG